ncbi:hypothetical protein BDY21DRAFT_336152 [Lineolata rhizophorae]|uniref:Uncharacterized protein n=1 Tax=Lineolata rhizophorae TaxID=578093 RepID=A0A6A6P9Y9_9PEZI|nr:hypothetical protein BDY21DRAFT_336152 [Lineolata rhizophorae]
MPLLDRAKLFALSTYAFESVLFCKLSSRVRPFAFAVCSFLTPATALLQEHVLVVHFVYLFSSRLFSTLMEPRRSHRVFTKTK